MGSNWISQYLLHIHSFTPQNICTQLTSLLPINVQRDHWHDFFFLKPFQKFWPFRFHLTYTLPLWCHYTSLLRMHPVKVVVQVLINSSSVLFTKLHNSHNNLLTIMYQYMLKFIILSLICLDPLSLFTKKLRHHNCVKLIEGTYISFYNIEVTTLTENPSSA